VARLDYPATRRNREPILGVLREVLPEQGRVLEIASGSGQHAAYFAAAMPGLRWQPTDLDPQLLASIRAWTEDLDNVAEPLALDVTEPDPDLPHGTFDALYCANMIHIAPWVACLGLLDTAARLLGPNATMCLYGPYKRNGQHTSLSNRAFDESLQSRNSTWGVRDLGVVEQEANRRNFELIRVVEMPANNLSVVFRAGSPAG